MSDELQDEVTSINSIYGDDTLSLIDENSKLYSLALPAQPSISLRIEFPLGYPDAPPSILGTQSIGNDTAKGEGTHLVELVRTILSEVYTPGAPCIFDIIEEAGQKLQQLGLDQDSRAAEQPSTQAQSLEDGDNGLESLSMHDSQHSWALGEPPPWVLSEVVTEKKSVFIARCAQVTSVEQAKSFLSNLLMSDKKVARATHNITAWRIRGENGVQFQDCDDDGETAAGGRLLHLLELMNVWDAMVIVTRWYGGVHLGPDRFRIINQCARDAIVKRGFAVQEDGKDSGKKKGKK